MSHLWFFIWDLLFSNEVQRGATDTGTSLQALLVQRCSCPRAAVWEWECHSLTSYRYCCLSYLRQHCPFFWNFCRIHQLEHQLPHLLQNPRQSPKRKPTKHLSKHMHMRTWDDIEDTPEETNSIKKSSVNKQFRVDVKLIPVASLSRDDLQKWSIRQ